MKIKSFEKTRRPCNGKVMFNVFIHFQVIYILFYTEFRPGQECAKCDQIIALNINSGYFITLFVFF